jgi:hypothetical protein
VYKIDILFCNRKIKCVTNPSYNVFTVISCFLRFGAVTFGIQGRFDANLPNSVSNFIVDSNNSPFVDIKIMKII